MQLKLPVRNGSPCDYRNLLPLGEVRLPLPLLQTLLRRYLISIRQMSHCPNQILIYFSPRRRTFYQAHIAIAAAVGSFITRNTFNPAISPASFVACHWESLNYAETVITALVTFSPR